MAHGEILKTLRVTATGATGLASSTRVYGVHWASPVAGGRVTIRDVDGSGAIMIDFDMPAAVSAGFLNLQQGGVRFGTAVHVSALPGSSQITLVYSPPQ